MKVKHLAENILWKRLAGSNVIEDEDFNFKKFHYFSKLSKAINKFKK